MMKVKLPILILSMSSIVFQMSCQSKSAGSGFVEVRELDGVWWFISPEGESFFSMGVNHAITPPMWLRSYNRNNTAKMFGKGMLNAKGDWWQEGNEQASEAEIKWLRHIEMRMEEWNFNSFGMHFYGLDHSLIAPEFYYTAEIKLMKYHTAMRPGDEWPDVFSEAFTERADAEARKVCAKHKNNPKLLGYYFTDEAAWMGFFRGVKEENKWWFYFSPWVDYLRRQPADTPGKQAWISLLKEIYASPREAANTYGIGADDWDTLSDTTDWPKPDNTPHTVRDSNRMLTLIAEQWYAKLNKAVRKYDPHHLIFGDKHYNDTPDWLHPILKKYVDVISIQRYGSVEAFKGRFDEIHRNTGKPIIIGDGSADYAPHMKPSMRGDILTHVYDEERMGEGYLRYAEELCSLPYMVGIHHCGFIQTWIPPEHGSYTRMLNSELTIAALPRKGLVDPFGKPYESFTRMVGEANKRAQAWHEGSANQ